MAFDLQTQLSKFLADLYAGTLGVNQPLTAVTILGPGTGAVLTNPSTNLLNTSGNFAASQINASAASYIGWTGRAFMSSPVDGTMLVQNNALTVGSGVVQSGAFQTMTALVALGAGGAATLGLTGGSGPATTTQNTWLRVVDSTGAACWVPVWK